MCRCGNKHSIMRRNGCKLFIFAMLKCGTKFVKPAAWTPQALDRETWMSNDQRPRLSEP